MVEQFARLFPYERQALLDALRRDMLSEQCKIKTDSDNATFHEINYRVVLKILETLCPKHAYGSCEHAYHVVHDRHV